MKTWYKPRTVCIPKPTQTHSSLAATPHQPPQFAHLLKPLSRPQRCLSCPGRVIWASSTKPLWIIYNHTNSCLCYMWNPSAFKIMRVCVFFSNPLRSVCSWCNECWLFYKDTCFFFFLFCGLYGWEKICYGRRLLFLIWILVWKC